MKIALVGNYPADSQQSMLRYTAFLERELRRAGHEVRLIFPRVVARKAALGHGALAKWTGYVDKYLLFRIGFSRQVRDADLVHICDHSNSMYLPWIKSVPKIVTCHDALAIRSALDHFPENSTSATGKMLQAWIRKSLRQADRVIYVSTKTQFDFEQLLGVEVPGEVIPQVLNWSYAAATESEISSGLRTYGLGQGRYILHVGGNDWYKNRTGVLRMFATVRNEDRFRSLRLVMAGKPLTEELRGFCRKNGLTDVLELPQVDNEQLRILYSGAFALLFPSFEEGFGWPILEAQACGCPVITSNRAPMTEVSGEGARFVDPTKPDSILEAVRDIDAGREAMITAGFRNLSRFSVADVICRYERCYRALLGDRSEILMRA